MSTWPAFTAYENVTANCRIKTKFASIRQRFRTTTFQFYLTALRALLLALHHLRGGSVMTAVADNGRSHDPREMEVIDPLVNLVLVRFIVESIPFISLLVASRDKTYAALINPTSP